MDVNEEFRKYMAISDSMDKLTSHVLHTYTVDVQRNIDAMMFEFLPKAEYERLLKPSVIQLVDEIDRAFLEDLRQNKSCG